MNQQAALLVPTLTLAGCVLISDPDWGLKRVATIDTLPEKQCVESALQGVAGVAGVRENPPAFRKGYEPPERMYFLYNFDSKPATKSGGAVQFVTRNGRLQYEAYYTAAHYQLPSDEISRMRNIYRALEGELARACRLQNLPGARC